MSQPVPFEPSPGVLHRFAPWFERQRRCASVLAPWLMAACGAGDSAPRLSLTDKAAGCEVLQQLSAANTVAITTPDAIPRGPVLAALASGSEMLAAWTDGGGTLNDVRVPEAIWAGGIRIDASGINSAPAMLLAADGQCPVVAASADGFAVVWSTTAGLQMQRFDEYGSLIGVSSSLLALDDADACPVSLLSTATGFDLAWYELTSTNERLARIDANGSVSAQFTLDQFSTTASPALAPVSLHDQTYLANVHWNDDTPETVISAIDWARTQATMQTVTPGFLNAFFTSGDQLAVGVAESQDLTLYVGAPADQPRQWTKVTGAWLAAADGCGRVAAIGAAGSNPAGTLIRRRIVTTSAQHNRRGNYRSRAMREPCRHASHQPAAITTRRRGLTMPGLTGSKVVVARIGPPRPSDARFIATESPTLRAW